MKKVRSKIKFLDKIIHLRESDQQSMFLAQLNNSLKLVRKFIRNLKRRVKQKHKKLGSSTALKDNVRATK